MKIIWTPSKPGRGMGLIVIAGMLFAIIDGRMVRVII